jgi:hypothetical protein
MISSFKTHWKNGKPTYFIPKIWESISEGNNWFFYETEKIKNDYLEQHCKNNLIDNILHKSLLEQIEADLFGKFEYTPVIPKYHTIRKGNRWKAGMKIHFAINNRSKNYFQFAPVIEAKFVQKITINKFLDGINIYIDDDFYLSQLDKGMLEEFAKNDGFDTFKDFIDFFFPNDSSGEFEGQIIHWTNLRY